MNLQKYPIKTRILALMCFLGSCFSTVNHSSFSQEEGFIPPPEKGQIGLRTELVKTPLCGYYVKEEHWDGSNVPKIIAYYESDEMWENNRPGYFALRNEDGFIYTLFAIPGTRCERCHQEPKERDYLFLKANQKPS